MEKMAFLVLLLLVLHSCQTQSPEAEPSEYQLSTGEHVECFHQDQAECGLMLSQCGPLFEDHYDCQKGAAYVATIDTD